MSIWTRIVAAISALAQGEPLTKVFEGLRTPPERSVAFTIAVIALGAKIAKADGHVTRAEVTAFRQVFEIPAADEANAARVFNLARQDVAGFEEYARRVRAMFGDGDPMLQDLLEGLFHIAMADGLYHPHEETYLQRVAEIFAIPDTVFRGIRARFVPDAAPDPYDVLGVSPDASMADIRAAWRQLVRDTHPDRMMAHGLPVEAIKLAETRMVAINKAWEEISRAQGLSGTP